MGPVRKWLTIYEMSYLAHVTIKIQTFMMVYSLINNAILKITYLFNLWLNYFFRSHVLITLFFGFVWLLSSKSLTGPFGSPFPSCIENSLVDTSREAWPKMAAPILKWRRPNSSAHLFSFYISCNIPSRGSCAAASTKKSMIEES